MTGMLSDVTADMVRFALDAASLKQLVYAHNIANANSPGYIPFRVSFSRELDAALRQTEKQGTAPPKLERKDVIIEPDPDTVGTGAAGVNLDWEVAKLSQNVVHYQALLRALSGNMAILSLAVSEGRK